MRKALPQVLNEHLLKKLIPGCGSLEQARNELRWLKDEIKDPLELEKAVVLRGEYNYPLQYILKSQPFGSINIICEPGALIPRWETEEWTIQLAVEIRASKQPKPTKILDICTGTGCILFLLCEMLKVGGVGLDLSSDALSIFRKNRSALHMQGFTSAIQHSLFDKLPAETHSCDLVVSNPPYILNKKEVEKSVLRFEPEIALYEVPNMWEALVSRTSETNARRAIFEVGEKQQIDEVVGLFQDQGWHAAGRKDGANQWRTVWATKQ